MKTNGAELANHVTSDKAVHAAQVVALTSLTAREQEVLRLLATGLAYKQIADELNVSANTVNNHLRNIRGKFGVHNSIEAIRKAQLWQTRDHDGPLRSNEHIAEFC